MRRLLLAALLCAVAVSSGCGSEGSTSAPDARTELERIIRTQLPRKVRRSLGTAVVVQNVQCTKAGGNKYDCIATVRGSDGTGRLVTQDVGIDATCDDQGCVWQTTQ